MLLVFAESCYATKPSRFALLGKVFACRGAVVVGVVDELAGELRSGRAWLSNRATRFFLTARFPAR